MEIQNQHLPSNEKFLKKAREVAGMGEISTGFKERLSLINQNHIKEASFNSTCSALQFYFLENE